MTEFKIIKVDFKEIKKDYTYAEKLMSEKAEEGWEVVSVSSDISGNIRGDLLITFKRETE